MPFYGESNMKRKKSPGWADFIGMLGILFLFLSSTVSSKNDRHISSEVEQNIVDRLKSGRSVGMVVGFIDSRGNREYFCSGFLTKKEEKKVDENSLYEIGSITKVFTCIALADMAIKGEIGFDQPAERYLPDEVKMPSRNGEKITLEHLAVNNSGLPRMPSNFHPEDIENPYADYTVENMYDFLSNYSLRWDIGKSYVYSNLGMGLLGHILSLCAGEEYEQLITRRICRVLGMDDTRISLTSAMKKRLAKGHNPAGEVPNWDIPALAGAGALRSTAKDMLTFLAANMGITSTPLMQAMDMSHRPRFGAGKNMDVGLGWHIRKNMKTQIIWHNGGTGGYRAFCGFIKDQKIGVVVLTNMDIGVDDIGFHLLDSSYPLNRIE